MQTLTEIRSLLAREGIRPRKKLGQCFLVDLNLMGKLLELANPVVNSCIFEVGAGTGSLTEELIRIAAESGSADRVVACEIDDRLFKILSSRFAGVNRLRLMHCDVLASKHAIDPAMVDVLGPEPVSLVANLPYNIATPLLAECLIMSWKSTREHYEGSNGIMVKSMTFTVQKEVADRLAASGGRQYGPVSVLVGLLGSVTHGTVIPSSAFWPPPAVESRMIRIDFDNEAAGRLESVDVLVEVIRAFFHQRRKQASSAVKRLQNPPEKKRFLKMLECVEIDPTDRPDNISPEQYGKLANLMSRKNKP